MTSSTSCCIQLGIFPQLDRLIVPVTRKRKPAPPMNAIQIRDLEAIRTRRTVIALESHGFTYVEIAAMVDRTPHWVYVLCKRSGLRRYRTDRYWRPTRVRKEEQPQQFNKAA